MKRYLSLFLLTFPLQGTSLVYNLKIRRSFTGLASFVKFKKKFNYVFTSLPVFYYRKAHFIIDRTDTDITDERIGGGSIFNFRVPSKHWWAEVTTAVHKESVSATGTHYFKASRIAFDDIVLAAGYNAFPTKDHQITIYGLTGFPTTRKLEATDEQRPLVGTRFFALGGGAEYSYSYINTPNTLLAGIIQVRALHFFTREAEALLGPCGRLQPGQSIDLLLSLRYRHKRTVLETGYNPTFFVNSAVLLPDETISGTTLIRHGGYISVVHLTQLSIGSSPLAIGGGLVYNRIKDLNSHNVIAFLNFTIAF